MDLQEGIVTFLGRLAIRGSLCLLPVQMRSSGKGCTTVVLAKKKYRFLLIAEPIALILRQMPFMIPSPARLSHDFSAL
ncbi:MAG TPA: hypothetical protein VLZ50_04020 [Terracidiphilus sp.]|nr:hypothetical protein [Terracidiphilus sp.]